jgi:hypothetical protein
VGSRPTGSGFETPSRGDGQASAYRPRHPETTVLYKALERDFEAYEWAHADRFEQGSGPLRPGVRKCVFAYLDCGRLHGGFARIRCPKCHAEHLLAFSCRTRNLCPSCQAKRSALFAEWVVEEVLLDVPHRHVVFTVPKALRRLIERERRLHGLMAKAAWKTLREMLSEAACEPRGVPGVVASLQTFGSFANFHPHVHIICTEGVVTPDGRFHPVIWPGKRDLEERFRRLFLTLLEKAKRLSTSFHETLLSWRHSGFSVDASQRVPAGERGRLERLARYATRVTLAVGAVRDRPDGRIEIETPPDPKTGARVKVLDRLDFIHAVCQQIPDAKLHQIRYYGAYSCKKRKFLREARAAWAGEGPAQDEDDVPAESLLVPSPDRPPPATPGSAEARRRSSWARMLRKVFEVDPLVCRRCGEEMVIVAWITKVDVIDRILRHRREKGVHSPFEP